LRNYKINNPKFAGVLNEEQEKGTGDEEAEFFEDQEGEEGEEGEEKESELKTHREKRQRIAAGASSHQAPSN
jgi:hypothetical protein